MLVAGTCAIKRSRRTIAPGRCRSRLGHTRRCSPSSPSSSACSTMASTTSTIDLDDHPDVPLQVHARYTRIEILAAFGIGAAAKVAAWQSGVYEAKAANAELFAFTLDKSSGDFSPTTRYRDYAISPHPHSLGEPIQSPAPTAPQASLSQPRTRRPLDHALRPSPQRRPRLLVPRPRHLPRPRRREADGHYLGTRTHRSPATCSHPSPPRSPDSPPTGRPSSAQLGAGATMRYCLGGATRDH